MSAALQAAQLVTNKKSVSADHVTGCWIDFVPVSRISSSSHITVIPWSVGG